jgi:low temperature requirement protein LtrA
VARRLPLWQQPRGGQVTNIELFFDLVYVFAIIQLSHHLLDDPTLRGALQAALLWAMVWLAWIHTTWVTSQINPEHPTFRVLLVANVLVSLVMFAALPSAFSGAGLVVGGAYAVQQVGRYAFVVIVLRGPSREPAQRALRRNFQRVLAWMALSGALAIGGGLAYGWIRALLWVLAVAIDVAGGALNFRIPGLPRSSISEWMIKGAHFAQRCQAFVLIAMGETIIIIGATASGMHHLRAAAVAAYAVTFATSVALWWLYFDRSADASSTIIAQSYDPGELARAAYHYIHPVMVAGIIVTAAADGKILSFPSAHPSAATTWLILGGPALFMAGHGAFRYAIWQNISWNHLAGIAVLALLAATAGVLPEVALAACAGIVVAVVAATDRRMPLAPAGTTRWGD